MNPQIEVKDITYTKPRACLFNFVMYTEEESKIAYLNNLGDMLLSRYPARIVVIFGDRNRREDLLEVFEETAKDPNTFPRSNVIVSGKRVDEVPLIALPFLVPDYPIYALWSGNPTTQNSNLDFLKQIASRLIFDAESCEDLKLFAEKMIRELQRTTTETVDANWARISGWRQVLAEVIDSPQRVELLNNSQRFEIRFAKGKYPQQALYLQAWLASRLGWQSLKKEDRGDRISIKTVCRGHTFEVHLISTDEQKLSPGSIISFEVENTDGAMISMARKEGSSLVLCHIASQDSCELPFSLYLPDLHRGSSFFTDLLWSKGSPQYRAMLELL